ncbi:MAG: hypothetical protein FGM13_09300 [Dechloromonas sp.]|nr:hypothetical protein [Dechloromonas sp.]
MALQASVAQFKNQFFAQPNDGGSIEQADFRSMAQALYGLGVVEADISFDWCPGQRMVTAGQQVALRAQIKLLAKTANVSKPNLAVAA